MSRATASLLTAALLGLVAAQTPDDTPEVHPKLTTYKCTTSGGCVAQTNALVLESSQHHIYQKDNPDYSCGDWGSGANTTACPDEATCQQNCILQGVSDYTERGVYTDGADLTMLMLSEDGSEELSPRIYLLNEAEDAYEMLQLTGQELTFDVDMAKLPCGMNSALYLDEMEARGGQDSSSNNISVAGAAYGTGYCDAQCYVTPFQNGVVSASITFGLGSGGADILTGRCSQGNINGSGLCCSEMDIWEANSRANQVAPHTCNQTGVYLCDVDKGECATGGVCDKSGCKQNPYSMGFPEYYGLGYEVDTSRPFTVVTQFHADETNTLTSYTRLYVQDDVVIEMPKVDVNGVEQNAMDDAYCEATNATEYMRLGATSGMGEALARGMVLIFSLWWDKSSNMTWLDSAAEGNGPCNATESNPTFIQQVQPDPQVTFSNIRWGDIGSTFGNNTGLSTLNTTSSTNGTNCAKRRVAAPLWV